MEIGEEVLNRTTYRRETLNFVSKKESLSYVMKAMLV